MNSQIVFIYVFAEYFLNNNISIYKQNFMGIIINKII